MNKSFNFSMLAQGYLETNKLEPMLVFTLENAFRTSSFDDFKACLKKHFTIPPIPEKYKKVKWIEPVKVFNGDVKSKKKHWCSFIQSGAIPAG